MLPTMMVNHSELLLEDMQVYIFDEYERIWDEYIRERRNEVPSIYSIVQRVYDVLHNRLSELLYAKYMLNSDKFIGEEDFQNTVALYSIWFDQQVDGRTYMDEALLHEVSKFFCLYQLFHERDGKLINQPILEVW